MIGKKTEDSEPTISDIESQPHKEDLKGKNVEASQSSQDYFFTSSRSTKFNEKKVIEKPKEEKKMSYVEEEGLSDWDDSNVAVIYPKNKL